MKLAMENFYLRKPEPGDAKALYRQKNDAEIASMLGGFSTGYSEADIAEWIEFHRKRRDEVVWVVAREPDGACMGHVGLYQIDQRVRSAEYAILIGERSEWGKGLGSACTRSVVEYGFRELNLNRIHLSVLSTNEQAIRIYRSTGFMEEGRLRQAQYKAGRYVDMIVMGLLREEHEQA